MLMKGFTVFRGIRLLYKTLSFLEAVCGFYEVWLYIELYIEYSCLPILRNAKVSSFQRFLLLNDAGELCDGVSSFPAVLPFFGACELCEGVSNFHGHLILYGNGEVNQTVIRISITVYRNVQGLSAYYPGFESLHNLSIECCYNLTI